MANTQNSSQASSAQFSFRPKPGPGSTTSLVEQQLRLSVESPQLLAAIEVLLPLAKRECRELSAPRSAGCDPHTAELIRNEAEAWAIGIALAEDALERIKPYSNVLVRYFHRFEAALRAKQAVQL